MALQVAVMLAGGGGGGAVTIRLFKQPAVVDWPFELTVTLAVFVPAAVYCFVTDCVVPVNESVPLQA